MGSPAPRTVGTVSAYGYIPSGIFVNGKEFMYDDDLPTTAETQLRSHMAQENVKTRPPSSADRWGTDRALVEKLGHEFAPSIFDWDWAAEESTNVTVKGHYFGPDHAIPEFRDSLAMDWSGANQGFPVVGFLNPPFTLLPQFVAKAFEERLKGACTVAVLPVKAEQPWWHQFVSKADELRFLRGRLRYIDPETGQLGDSARFASAVVVWDGRKPVMMGGPRVSWWNWRA